MPLGGVGGLGERVPRGGSAGEYLRGPPTGEVPWSSLVVDFGDDLAVRVSSPAASRADLLDVVDEIDLPDADDPNARIAPPRVPSPPDGLTVVGSMDARAVLGEMTYAWGAPEMHGPPGSFVALWLGPGDLELIVQTLPGDSTDLAGIVAAPREQHVEARLIDLDGHGAAIVESTDADPAPHRERHVWFGAAGGDLIHVVSRGSEPLTLRQLTAVALSVREASDQQWDAVVGEFES